MHASQLPDIMKIASHLLLVLSLVTTSLSVGAEDFTRTPLPKNHPLIGSWRIAVPGTQCHEVYTVKSIGTASVTSGAQVAESEFQIDHAPTINGFYKWIDKITRDNGEPDCMGSIMEVGHIATNFIMVHPSGKTFLMCISENLISCLGPFKRLEEGI
jgi:hypothetical protein